MYEVSATFTKFPLRGISGGKPQIEALLKMWMDMTG